MANGNHLRYYDSKRVRREAQNKRRMVLRLRATGKTLQQIAEMWGISRQRVGQIDKKAREMLRRTT